MTSFLVAHDCSENRETPPRGAETSYEGISSGFYMAETIILATSCLTVECTCVIHNAFCLMGHSRALSLAQNHVIFHVLRSSFVLEWVAA